MEEKCKSCIHEAACQRWVAHGKTLYDDFDYSVEGCPDYAPTVDAVEVVRCKDCFADGCCSVQIDLDMGGEGYCPKGKRRTE